MEPAPLRDDLADGPEGGQAFWLRAKDGVRLRAAIWPGGDAGTVFLFPGRTEYIEKYGPTARAIAAQGYGICCIDWRGQGMSDRLIADPCIGHVEQFSDYQLDVTALLDLAAAQDMPKPWFLLAHSMGGCIGLRTLTAHTAFKAAVFSAPMWGLYLTPIRAAMSTLVPLAAKFLGLGHMRTPTTSRPSYMLETEFTANALTSDRDSWAFMVEQAQAEEQFRLGGPSLSWVGQAMAETSALAAAARPDLPVYTCVGTAETIVSTQAIKHIMSTWPTGTLDVFEGGKHEILMETSDLREPFLDRTFETFARA